MSAERETGPASRPEIVASKRRASIVALVLAVVGSTTQVVAYNLGDGNALGFTILMYSGVLVAALGVVIACAALVGRGSRLVAMVAVVVAVAPVVLLVTFTAFTPMMTE